MKSLIKTLLFIFPLFAQYPADSLFNAPKNSIFQKLLIYPITKWQRVSYNDPNVNCQFHPNCSLYGAQAIHENGSLAGLFMTSDRIVRCSPFAYKAHTKINGQYHIDGRMIDPVDLSKFSNNNKSPIFAAGLSMLIPGLGRAYSGRGPDGFFGFMISGLSINSAIKSYNQNSIFSPLWIGVAIIIYGGEVYGAYRTAKYYQVKNNIEQ